MKPELTAPAGDLEKLKIAVDYGANAVYLGGKSFGLRAKAKNFDYDDMQKGVEYAHKSGVKVYVTVNIFARDDDFEGLEKYILELTQLNIDAVIVSDPGVFSCVRQTAPELNIHISTQANNTNSKSALFWREQGATRIIVARELSLNEIRKMRQNIPKDFQMETFVHGAMCMSYSGRCLLSNYMSARDANKGECSHPCRWSYSLVEEKRPGEYYPVFQDERGTYIFNSKDLCMLEHIDDLIVAGIDSFKIEGRMKTAHYVGATVKIYREAIDDYFTGNMRKDYYMNEIRKVSNRDFSTGFYFGNPEENAVTTGNRQTYDFVGIVTNFDTKTHMAEIEQRNKFSVGEEIEFLLKTGEGFTQKIEEIYNEAGEKIKEAPHPQQVVFIKTERAVKKLDMLRRKRPTDNA